MKGETGKFYGGHRYEPEQFCLDECISIKLKQEMDDKGQIMFICNDSLSIHRYFIAKKQEKWGKVIRDIAKKWRETSSITKLKYKSKWIDPNTTIQDLMDKSGFKQNSYIKAAWKLPS